MGGVVEQHGTEHERKRFGRYLRTIREERKLSLDTVEEMSVGFPERITKSHLSRIENGQAIPTFPRMFTLSQIYGIPVASLAERFEIVLLRSMESTDLKSKSAAELLAEAKRHWVSGGYREALQIYDALLDRWRQLTGDEDEQKSEFVELSLNRITCLVHLARYVSAKEECENLLGSSWLSTEQRVTALHYFTMCCYRLSKFPIAMMALDETRREMKALPPTHRLHAYMAGIEGNVKFITGRYSEAGEAYKSALRGFQRLNNPFEACRFRLNLGSALIRCERTAEARQHLRTVLNESRNQGYDRLRALAISSLALAAYREGDVETAERYCIQSNQIARPREYYSVVFRNCYYLWRIALQREDEAAARANERALRANLSRVEDFLPEAEDYRRHLTGGGK
jgi:transcriptional regulator with XRE-family HTH domain